MGLIKDWVEDTEGYRFSYRVRSLFDLSLWLRLRKWRKQRANRGWSDRDTWNAGDHIALMTVEMLQKLIDNKYTDWPEWFKLNVQEEGKGAYKDLQSVIDDIKAYLDFEWTSWGDGLYADTSWIKHEDGSSELGKQLWYDEKTNKLQTEAAIKHRMNKWHKEYTKKYKKAQKAMGFFARHFSHFWD